MKQKIEDILEETGYKESRAAKMDLNDILKSVCCPSSLVLSDSGFADCYWPFMILTSISLDRPVILSLYQLSILFLQRFDGLASDHLTYSTDLAGAVITIRVRHSR